MSAAKATLSTLEQEALIPTYQAKWRKMTLSTETIDSTLVTSLLRDLYTKLGLRQPDIRFFDSPYAALSSGIFDRASHSIRCQLENLLGSLLKQEPLLQDFDHQLWRLTGSQVASNLGFLLQSQLEEQWVDYPQKWLWEKLDNCLQPQLWQDCHGSWFDFFISVFHYAHNERTWALLQALGQQSGWLFPYHDLCIVFRRPSKLLSMMRISFTLKESLRFNLLMGFMI